MKKINAAVLSGFVLTTIVVFIMSAFPYIPVWATFIAWACFFHMGGGDKPNQAFVTTNVHMGIGAIASWLSALLLFTNPFATGLANQLWAPVLIGIVIAILVRMSTWPWLAMTSAIVYGYAAIWAFLSLPGTFNVEALMTLSFQNAVIAILVAVFIGTCGGYANARLVNLLANEPDDIPAT